MLRPKTNPWAAADLARNCVVLHLRATYPAARGMTTSPLINHGHTTTLKGDTPLRGA